jgi:hypothetical protein
MILPDESFIYSFFFSDKDNIAETKPPEFWVNLFSPFVFTILNGSLFDTIMILLNVFMD